MQIPTCLTVASEKRHFISGSRAELMVIGGLVGWNSAAPEPFGMSLSLKLQGCLSGSVLEARFWLPRFQ